MLSAIVIGGGIGSIAITLIILFAVVAIVYIAARQMGVAIPGWVVRVFWIVVIAAVCILAIRFLLGL